jgi:hypothetical protein
MTCHNGQVFYEYQAHKTEKGGKWEEVDRGRGNLLESWKSSYVRVFSFPLTKCPFPILQMRKQTSKKEK